MPVISVITSVFNAQETLKDSVLSILDQTYTDFEFIIVDDGSTDDSLTILGQLSDSRIVLLKNKGNIGLSASLNRALSMAKGKFVARHDADDTSLPNRLKLQAKFMDENPEVGVLGGQMQVVNDKGEVVEDYTLPTSHAKLAWRLLFDRSFAHPTVMMRRELVVQVGGYEEALRVSQDHQLWTKLVTRTRFANLPDMLVRYRALEAIANPIKSQDQHTNRMRSRQKLVSGIFGKEVPLTHIRWMDASQKFPCNLTEEQRKVVLDLITQSYEAYKRAGILNVEDLSEIHKEYVDALFNVGGCGRADTSGAQGKYSGLAWAIRHPLRATSKILKMGEYSPTQAAAPLLKKHEKPQGGLTIVVLTHDRLKSLESLLQDLSDQKLNGTEIELVIVNNSSKQQIGITTSAHLNKLISGFIDSKVLNSSFNWGTPARYAATILASHETSLFLDDDIRIKDKYFIGEMHAAFQTLDKFDILSCWNELWVDWDEHNLKTVSLDFNTPGINEIMPTDTIGPGIAMFNRETLLDQRVLRAAIPRNDEKPMISDMAFPLMAAMVNSSRCFYYPAWGKLAFHDQAHKGAIYRIPGRHEALLGSYKELLNSGYQPVLSNPARLSQVELDRVTWAAETLPAKQYHW